MAKRFTETSKWSDPWFRKLSPLHKLAWMYICDCCDVAGIIELDRGLANFVIGAEVDWDCFVEAMDGRVQTLAPNCFWIVGFIEFQYTALSRASRPHAAAIRLLEKWGLDIHPSVTIADESDRPQAVRSRISRKYRESIYTLDEFRCQSCGHQFPKHELTLDHLVGIHAGGRNQEENLYTFCCSCNSKKGQLDIARYLERYEVTLPDNRLSRFLNTPNKGLQSLQRVPGTLKDKDKDKEKEKEEGESEGKRQRFSKPTVEEVAAYCVEKGNGVDAQKFWNFYESKGWMIGKNPMRNWKSAIATWVGNSSNSRAGPAPPKSTDQIAASVTERLKSYGHLK